MTHLLVTVRFLDDRYHGLLDRNGPPEWPPSPFRLFQALVAGAARRGKLVVVDDKHPDTPDNKNFTPIGQALGWLQRHTREHPPIIIAPKSKTGQAITRFVPNNDGDKKFDRQERLTAKPTIPTLFVLEPDQKPEVHYVWDIAGRSDCPITDIERAARSLTALGWGIDMAFADARLADEAELQKLKGVRWYPKKNAGSFRDTLRMPTYDDKSGQCTLCDLRHCHSTFINRIEHGKPLKTVDKPKVFERVLYTSVERPARRPCYVFKLLDDNLDTTRYPQPLLAHIAAVVRHAAIESMRDGSNAPSGMPAAERGEWVNRFVRGLNEPRRDDHQQISYVPLPSIGAEHSDAMIRNVMLVAPLGCEAELEHVASRLDGAVLEFKGDTGEPCDTDTPPRTALPHAIELFNPPQGKFIDKCYLGRSKVWQSVTPVILDEHAKKVERRNEATGEIEKLWNHDELICKALQRASIETPCKFTWQTLPFYKNCVTAHRYDRNKRPNFVPPKRLDGKTAVHLRLMFEQEVPGPVTIGAGRHCGFGLFAAVAP
ncbi:MAG: type I-U CRISPR-associated protein Csb2 [Planctomycetes bacterium]|nr:type I-U CRISPR-associated protein Csb2 [Planctomycetota bacterium]